jgi:hypothetical protein
MNARLRLAFAESVNGNRNPREGPFFLRTWGPPVPHPSMLMDCGAVMSTSLNASGCLDALTAPDVARDLDAFVTKTVTPLPREVAPAALAELRQGCSTRSGCRTRESMPSSRTACASCRSWRPGLGLGGEFSTAIPPLAVQPSG